MPHGGKRPGSGRPKLESAKRTTIGIRATAETAATLRQYNQSEAVRLLASGLSLGAGNAPELTPDEADCLRSVLVGSVVDALFIRHLTDEVEDSEHPAAASLLAKLHLPQVGDWERLHLVLKYAA